MSVYKINLSDWRRHFCTPHWPFNRSIIDKCVCESIVSGITSHEQLNRFCHFCTPCRPFNRSVIDSAVFAHHSIGLYSMCGWSLYRHRVWNDIARVCRATRSVHPFLNNSRLCPLITTCPWFMSVNQSCLG